MEKNDIYNLSVTNNNKKKKKICDDFHSLVLKSRHLPRGFSLCLALTFELLTHFTIGANFCITRQSYPCRLLGGKETVTMGQLLDGQNFSPPIS